MNDLPIARGESYVTYEDSSIVVAAPGLLANDTDVEPDSLTTALATAPAHGSAVIEPPESGNL